MMQYSRFFLMTGISILVGVLIANFLFGFGKGDDLQILATVAGVWVVVFSFRYFIYKFVDWLLNKFQWIG